MRRLLLLFCLLFSPSLFALSCTDYLAQLAVEEQMSEEQQMELIWDGQYQGAADLWLQAYRQLADDANTTALEIMHKRLKMLSRTLKKGYGRTLSQLRLNAATQTDCSQAPETPLVTVVARQLPRELVRLHEKAQRWQRQIELEKIPPLLKQ